MKKFIIDILFKLAVVGLLSCQLYYLSQLPTSGNVWVEGGSLSADVRGTVDIGNEVDVKGTVDVGNVIGSVDVDVIDTVDVNGSVSVDDMVLARIIGSVDVNGTVSVDNIVDVEVFGSVDISPNVLPVSVTNFPIRLN